MDENTPQPKPEDTNATAATYKHLDQLHEWDKNPRNINEKDFNRLKDQLELKGQFKPLLITEDGTVLGGNMRLKAMRELGWNNVWVKEIQFKQNQQGLWEAYIDGQPQKENYLTKEDGMMSYSLTDNDRAGYYDSELMANIMPQFNLEWDNYAIDFDTPQTIQDFINDVAPDGESKESDEQKKEMVVQCPGCNQEFNAYEHTITN